MPRRKSNTTVYHHTNTTGALKILKSGRIRPSNACFGKGTYVTKMGPQQSKNKIAKNNYDGSPNYWQYHKKLGKTDVAMELKMPRAKITSVNETGRDVYKVKGGISTKFIHRVHFRKKDNQNMFASLSKPKRKKKDNPVRLRF
ncbi:Hypothetical predicted protein [Mytilus galloprovincialis]|uniref:Uncharacterized protein n=1 Tax=Mytilus galloprovincialis TaxID=29158 RepID=A0A8B6F522_MYTGA|nr:Hypothetical predicted protein [Mytilus galloprovincialis]